MDEETEPNDEPQQAGTIEIDGERLGAFEDGGGADWFVMTLAQALPVTLRTAPFCDSESDPKLEVYDQLGLNLLATDQGSAGGGHPELTVSLDAGTYSVKVSNEELALIGEYVLSVIDARCRQDTDCGCADQRCDGDADSPGACVPMNPTVESESAVALTAEARIHGRIDQAFDVDTFEVFLAPGRYQFATIAYCDSASLDTELTLFGPEGVEVADDSDSGDAFFATISEYVVTSEGTYRVAVSAFSVGTGDYLLEVTALP